jgi:hypothetical protein
VQEGSSCSAITTALQMVSSAPEALAAFQTKHGRAGTDKLTAVDALTLGGTALALRKKLDWQSLDTVTGMTMSYPAALLSKRETSQTGGETLTSRSGSISLLTPILTRSKGCSTSRRTIRIIMSPINFAGRTSSS